MAQTTRARWQLHNEQGPLDTASFWQDPAAWAASLGFAAQLVEPWPIVSARQAQQDREANRVVLDGPSSLGWTSADPEARMLEVRSWLDTATRMRALALNRQRRDSAS